MLDGHFQKDQKLIIKTNYRWMQVKSIFRPSLNYHFSLRYFLCTLNHKLQLQLWLVPEKMLNTWYIFKILQDAEKIFYPVIFLPWSFFQRYVGFTASIALCNLKLIITRSWQGAHFLVPRTNSVLVVRTVWPFYITYFFKHLKSMSKV